jgi:hypothetical protein
MAIMSDRQPVRKSRSGNVRCADYDRLAAATRFTSKARAEEDPLDGGPLTNLLK